MTGNNSVRLRVSVQIGLRCRGLTSFANPCQVFPDGKPSIATAVYSEMLLVVCHTNEARPWGGGGGIGIGGGLG